MFYVNDCVNLANWCLFDGRLLCFPNLFKQFFLFISYYKFRRHWSFIKSTQTFGTSTWKIRNKLWWLRHSRKSERRKKKDGFFYLWIFSYYFFFSKLRYPIFYWREFILKRNEQREWNETKKNKVALVFNYRFNGL